MSSQAHNPKGFFPAYPAQAKTQRMPVAASQTLARGDAIIISSGQVAIALANSAEIAGVIAQASVGAAAATMVEVWNDPDQVFIGRANAGNAIAAGATCDIIGATGAMELDENATSTNVAKIVELLDDTEAATAAGKRYKFKWNLHAFADTST